jgi:alpha-beta hydrolase superfamily lysophospholipase
MDYLAPDGVRTRGTVIVVPGRGETPGVYARFGARLASDAYRVRVVEAPGTVADLADRLADAVDGIADGLVRPLVLVGSDLGAATIAALLTGFVPDALLDAVYQSVTDVPQLLPVGDADPLADRSAIARAAKSQPAARLAVVRGGHHDVLNDVQHRSVAAEVVTFLEAVRDGLSPAIAVEASTW